ncbi:hypothetical protein DL766_008507 [Monosporascus sp. MC13-8B]|nr:hypothetical protein DL763_006021 [Monosporascus cannonballus]RYP19155.1 hypothetical protein DL766_008507 [Monosporascus sp. MC13-8B]
MMDSDDYDDDIADEDLIVAASQAPSRTLGTTKHSNTSRLFQTHVKKPALYGNSFNLQKATPAPRTTSTVPTIPNRSPYIDLDDLPSDAFSSPPRQASVNRQGSAKTSHVRASQPVSRVNGQSTTYRQTTLFGLATRVNEDPPPSQPARNRAFRADLPPEAPSHHELDVDAMKTWVYPTNLGPTRDYQFSIVKNGLFNNVLVALPTGLGKTFIAATIMLNFYRWTKTAKIVFMAPTKPLVAQQIDACFNIAGIPRSETTLLTGEITPALRADEWESKRVFFMTPQTLENDLSHGIADPKSIALLVVDEAHRATGNYAYVKVVNFMRRFSNSFRVLALTATPGTKVESIQEVIDSLGISHVEIRTEESIDIRQYVHKRDEDIILLDPSEEMVVIKDLFSKALKPLVDKLSQQNIYYGRDPMSLTTYGLLKARQDWLANAGRHANQGVKFMVVAIFAILQSLAHAIKLLNFHGIKPFYDSLVQFRDEVEGKGVKGSKNKKQIIESPSFQEMMNKIGSWCSKDDFISHPKLTCLSDTVLNHFMDAGEGRGDGSPSNTRVIVFSEYRDSAEEIVRVLNTHKPLLRAAVFVGQADSKRSDGMKQSEQIERIKKFKEGVFNVLVATSIGEEGLDIGQVDLIICFDASASPIRMLQRMGRTGRKRAGRVVLLLMRGKEEENYAKSKDAYEKLQVMICDGNRFNFRHDLSTRIVPRDIRPEVDLRAVEIPPENTQNQSLPEPKKGRPRKKKPPKKFHMPDGVETGFTSVASMLGKQPSSTKPKGVQRTIEEQTEIAPIPELNKVMLRQSQVDELNRIYKNLPTYRQDKMQYIDHIDFTKQPAAQRALRKTVNLKHGEYTKRCVRLFRTLAKSQSPSGRYEKPYGDSDKSRYKQLPLPESISDTEGEFKAEAPRKRRKVSPTPDDNDDEVVELPSTRPFTSAKTTKKPSMPKRRNTCVPSDVPEYVNEDQLDDSSPPPAARRRAPAAKKQAPKAPTAAPKRRGRPPKKKQTPHAAAARYDESADEGDDCRRTSDLELTEDSDDGSDLADFVVGDDVATSSNAAAMTSSPRRSTSPTSPSSTVNARDRSRPKPYYEPTRFPSPSQEDSDDMPSMSQLVGGGSKKRVSKTATAGSDDEGAPVHRNKSAAAAGINKRGKKRRAVLDDEEDEDSDDD